MPGGSFSSSKMNADSSGGFNGDDPAADGHSHREGWKGANHRTAAAAAGDNYLGHSDATMDQSEAHQQQQHRCFYKPDGMLCHTRSGPHLVCDAPTV